MENKNYREIYDNLTVQELEETIEILQKELGRVHYKIEVLKKFDDDEYQIVRNQLKEVKHKIAYCKVKLAEQNKEENVKGRKK